MTPAGTSNELDVQNEREENTTHTRNVCMYGHHMQSMGQPGKVVNPARGQLNREN